MTMLDLGLVALASGAGLVVTIYVRGWIVEWRDRRRAKRHELFRLRQFAEDIDELARMGLLVDDDVGNYYSESPADKQARRVGRAEAKAACRKMAARYAERAK